MSNPLNRVNRISTDDRRLGRFSEQVSDFAKSMPAVLATGKQNIANNTTVDLHTAALNENELYSGFVSIAASETSSKNIEAAIPSSGRLGYWVHNDGSGNNTLRVQNDGTSATITVVWVAFKWVLPQVTS